MPSEDRRIALHWKRTLSLVTFAPEKTLLIGTGLSTAAARRAIREEWAPEEWYLMHWPSTLSLILVPLAAPAVVVIDVSELARRPDELPAAALACFLGLSRVRHPPEPVKQLPHRLPELQVRKLSDQGHRAKTLVSCL